jgi:hypothetical protein
MAGVAHCPRCDAEMRVDLFLCMACANAVPDEVIVRIGAAVDDEDPETFADAMADAVTFDSD